MNRKITQVSAIILVGLIALAPATPAQSLAVDSANNTHAVAKGAAPDGELEDPEGNLTDEPLVAIDASEAHSGPEAHPRKAPDVRETTRRPTPINCKITQDSPHISQTAKNGYTVNTHLRGKCPISVVTNTVTGSTYRSAWFGWVHQKSGTGSGSRMHKKLNLAFRCHKNKTYNYRSQGRYYSTFSNGYRGLTYRTTSKSKLKCTYR